jgi:hypothetical protein
MKTYTVPQDATDVQRKIMLKRIQRALQTALKRIARSKT